MRITIVGAGIFGLAAALELRSRGHHVTICEQEQIPCPRASSTDESKSIRRTNYREKTYVELVQRAAHQWRIWHQQLSRAIYFQSGLLMIDYDFSPASRAYHNLHTLGGGEGGVQLLSLTEARRRFPQFAFKQEDVLIYDPWAGYLRSAQALTDLADLARSQGVKIHEQTPVTAVKEIGDEVQVICEETLTCDRAILAAGAWIVRLLPQLTHHLRITRQQMAFFRTDQPEAFARERFPNWLVRSTTEVWYGFPYLQEGYLKVTDDLTLEEAVPDVARDATPEFLERVRQFVADRLPVLAGAELIGGRSCLYTNTPDDHFIIDWAPGSRRVLISGCGSGHGFKFGASIGPVIADALEDKHNPLGNLFRIGDRFSEDVVLE